MRNHMPDVSKMVHTAKTLGKYLGMKVYCDKEKKVGELYRLSSGNGVDLLSETTPRKWSRDLTEHTGHTPLPVYPILKTVDDLTEEDYPYSPFNNILTGVCLRDEFEPGKNDMGLTLFRASELLQGLLINNAGAVPDKDSPTGYVSIFDGLPCKRWAEVFNG